MRLAALTALAVLAIAGCGGEPSPEDQVRETAHAATEALLSDHPERSCQYQVDRKQCVGAAVLLKGMDVGAMIGIPDDWEQMLEKATVTVDGDRATLAGFDINGDGKPGVYIKKGEKWFSDNR